MKRTLLILFIVVLGGLVAFHFVAEHQAEQNIDKTIQAQLDSLQTPVTVQYSSIQVKAFSGDIIFDDVNIVSDRFLHRAKKMTLDLDYGDFLNIYLFGTEYGLKQLNKGTLSFQKASSIGRQSRMELTSQQLDIDYDGNGWDVVRALFLGRPIGFDHRLKATASKFHYTRPNARTGTFRSDSLHLDYTVLMVPTQEPRNSLALTGIRWQPPARFQKKYGYLIQRFDVPLDSIPIERAGLTFSSLQNREVQLQDGSANLSLFSVTLNGRLMRDSTWTSGSFAPLTISITEPTATVAENINALKQLFNLPQSSDGPLLQFRLTGPFSNPRFSAVK